MPLDDPMGYGDPMGGGLDLSALGEMMPQAPVQQAPQQGGNKFKEFAPLLALLPIAAAKGGRMGVASLLQSFQQARQQQGMDRERQGLQQQRQTEAEETRNYRNQVLQGQQTQQRAAADTAAATRKQAFLKDFTAGFSNISTADELNAYLDLMLPAGQQLGIRGDVMRSYAQQVLAPSKVQQRNAEKYLDRLKQQHGDKWMDTAAATMHTLPGEETPVSFEQLLTLAGRPKDPSYTPPAPKPETAPAGFTLSEGQVRYGPDGQVIARGPAKAASGGTSGGGGQQRGLVSTVMANPALWDDLTPSVKSEIAADLAAAGFTGFGKRMSDATVVKLSEAKSAIASLRDLRQVLLDNEQYIGPIAGLQALNPYSEARKAQSNIDLVRQRVGKALEGGVLRKEDEEKYKKILATLTDEPTTAIYKIDSLIETMGRDMETFIEEQRSAGRRVNPGTTPPSIQPVPSHSTKPSAPSRIGRFQVTVEP